jgi:hypothetical protein
LDIFPDGKGKKLKKGEMRGIPRVRRRIKGRRRGEMRRDK